MLHAPELESYFVPNVPDSSPAVQISLSLIHRLGFDVLEAFKSVPKRGLEIGGILLGYVLPAPINSFRQTILVEEFEPVDSEHEQGPSYLLSERDKLLFEQAVSRHRNQPAGELRPVGFYRSQTRGGFDFDEHDIAIAQSLFSREPSVCLLIKPSADGTNQGRIGIWSDAALESFETFPFRATALRDGGFPITSPPAESASTPTEIPAAAPSEDNTIAVTSPPPRWQTGWVRDSAVLLGLAAALLFAAFLTRSGGHTDVPASPTQQAEPLQEEDISLNVERKNGSAVLTWNHASPAVQRAESGLLVIVDAGKQQELHLDRTELETGRIVYVPGSNDVSFRMQLFAPGHSSIESVRSLAGVPQGDAAAQTPVRKGEWAPTAREGDDEEEQESDNTPARRPSPFSTPESGRPTLAPARVANPSVVTPAPPVETAAAPLALPEPATVPPPEPAPNPVTSPNRMLTSVSVEPIGRSGLKRVWTKLSPEHLLHYSDPNRAIPARALREVQPKLSTEMISSLSGEREVDVKVTISRSGDVVKTELKAHDVNDRVAYAVIRAAREWTFEPARDDRNNERHALLRFHLKHLDEIALAPASADGTR
ncbi:MAG TPA: hypothetical protein VK789_30335 [Bryobacteraceae bacterium]|nr:hypothetical protein [Bryobacteraceae bacterium]